MYSVPARQILPKKVRRKWQWKNLSRKLTEVHGNVLRNERRWKGDGTRIAKKKQNEPSWDDGAGRCETSNKTKWLYELTFKFIS